MTKIAKLAKSLNYKKRHEFERELMTLNAEDRAKLTARPVALTDDNRVILNIATDSEAEWSMSKGDTLRYCAAEKDYKGEEYNPYTYIMR